MNNKLLLNSILAVIFFLLYINISKAESFDIDSPNSITDSLQIHNELPNTTHDNNKNTNSNDVYKPNLPMILDDPNDFDKVANPNPQPNTYNQDSESDTTNVVENVHHNYDTDTHNNNNNNSNEVYKPNLPIILDDPNDFDKVSNPNISKQTQSNHTDSDQSHIINESSLPLDNPNLINQIKNNTHDKIITTKPTDSTNNHNTQTHKTNTKHKPVSKKHTNTKHKPVSKKHTITKHKPVSKKHTVTKHKPVTKKHTVTKHKPITKKHTVTKRKPVTKHLAKRKIIHKPIHKAITKKKAITPKKVIKQLTHAQLMAKTKRDNANLQKWFKTIKTEARKKGVSSKTFDYLTKQARIRESVLISDHKQPEFNLRLSAYLKNMLAPARIKRGRFMLKKYHTFLRGVEKKYGVQPEYLVAFWGEESFYGQNMGNLKLLNSLSTLAYRNHRKDFFKAQLFVFMKMVQDRVLDENTLGSWAGALGNLQFMPGTLQLYGADGDGDGYIDIINSPKDALESAANYLKRIGWQATKRWGRVIRIPRNFKGYKYVGETKRRPAKIWNRLGLKTYTGKKLIIPNDMDARIDMPEGHRGLAFIYYNNFHIIYRWNVSRAYSISIGLLANALRNEKMPNFSYYLKRIKQPKRSDILQVQRHLINLGYLPKGSDDSVVGSTTAQAIKVIQTKTHLIPDGYLDKNTILRILRYKTKYRKPTPRRKHITHRRTHTTHHTTHHTTSKKHS